MVVPVLGGSLFGPHGLKKKCKRLQLAGHVMVENLRLRHLELLPHLTRIMATLPLVYANGQLLMCVVSGRRAGSWIGLSLFYGSIKEQTSRCLILSLLPRKDKTMLQPTED